MQGVNITKQTPIFIYGGGEQGNIVANKLKSQGYNVFAGLDRYKSGKHIINNIFTYTLGSEPDFAEKKEGIVIICLANGLLHKTVADQLYQAGYRYIVFLPLEYNLCTKMKEQLTNQYNIITNPITEVDEINIIYNYEKYKTFDFQCTNAILEEDKDYVTVLINLEILHSVSYDLCEGDKTKIFSKPEYRDINIAQHPYNDLYSFFNVESDSLHRYFGTLELKREEDEKREELNKRENLYRIFKTELQKGMNFFVSSAPMVVMNPKGYFNLAQGHHRTLFLLNEQYTLFPVKMKINDFKVWCNNKVYEELKNWILEKGIEKTYAPIPHPGMLDFLAEHERFGRTRMQKILNTIKDISGRTVLEYGPTEGYFSRVLVRAGARNATYVSEDLIMINTAEIICKLLYMDNISFHNRLCVKNAYDIVVIVEGENTVISWSEIDTLTKKVCLLETKKQVTKVVEDISRTEFQDVDILFQEYYKGDILYLYILSK